MTTICPHCHKRLLSSASVNCNWCGQPVADADFQARAQTERDAFFAHQAERDALSLARTDAIDPFSAITPGFPPPSRRISQTDLVQAEAKARAAAQQALAEEKREAGERARREAKRAADEASQQAEDAKPGARFRHLEL